MTLISSDSWISRLLLENKSMKLLSILLAAVSWYSIRSVIGVTKVVYDIPIAVKVKEGMAVLSQSASTVAVTFKGSQEDVARLEEAHIKARIKAVVYAKAKDITGEEIVTISPRNIEGADAVRAVKVKPNSVDIQLSRESEKLFLVKVLYSGKPALGQVMSVLCEPASVRVRGAKRKLDELKDEELVVYTETVSVDGISESFAKSVRVFSPSDQWVSRIEPSEVVARVTIERKPASRGWTNVPIAALIETAVSVSAEIRPTKANVIFTGRKDILDDLTEDDFRVFVDCEGLDLSATYDLPLTVYISPEIDVSAAVNPTTVQVVLKEAL